MFESMGCFKTVSKVKLRSNLSTTKYLILRYKKHKARLENQGHGMGKMQCTYENITSITSQHKRISFLWNYRDSLWFPIFPKMIFPKLSNFILLRTLWARYFYDSQPDKKLTVQHYSRELLFIKLSIFYIENLISSLLTLLEETLLVLFYR